MGWICPDDPPRRSVEQNRWGCMARGREQSFNYNPGCAWRYGVCQGASETGRTEERWCLLAFVCMAERFLRIERRAVVPKNRCAVCIVCISAGGIALLVVDRSRSLLGERRGVALFPARVRLPSAGELFVVPRD